MKPLLFLGVARLVTNFLLSLFALFLRPVESSLVETLQPLLGAPHFSAAPCKTADTCKAPLFPLPDEDRVFEKVETEASMEAAVWKAPLQKYLTPFFDSAAANIPVGSYTVDVRFVVETDGRISGATAISDPGYGLAKISANAIREGPRWKPGEINTCSVRSYHTQPVIFMVTPDECDADTTKGAVRVLPPHVITPGKCEAGTAVPLMLSP